MDFEQQWLSLTVFQFSLGGPLAGSLQAQERDHDKGGTDTPIKHVIVLIGENRTFDHLFATYVPRHGESVKNLLSEGIIKADGTPGATLQQGPAISGSRSIRVKVLHQPG